jgi:hypothetical protein
LKLPFVGITRNPSEQRKLTFDFAGSGHALQTPKIRNLAFGGEKLAFKLAVNTGFSDTRPSIIRAIFGDAKNPSIRLNRKTLNT